MIFFFSFFLLSIDSITVVSRFGSGEVGEQTGIVLNDGMDDFAIPGRPNAYKVQPSEVNFIDPYKMPLSSMCPTLVIDTAKHNVTLSIGAAGGSRITTAVAYVRISGFVFVFVFRKKNRSIDYWEFVLFLFYFL